MLRKHSCKGWTWKHVAARHDQVTSLVRHRAAHLDKWTTSQTFDLDHAISTLQKALDTQRPLFENCHRVEFLPVMELRSAFGGWRFTKSHVAHCSGCGGIGWRDFIYSTVVGKCVHRDDWSPTAASHNRRDKRLCSVTHDILEPRRHIIALLQRALRYAAEIKDQDSIPINQFALDTITTETNEHCSTPVTAKKLLCVGKWENLKKRATAKVLKRPAGLLTMELEMMQSSTSSSSLSVCEVINRSEPNTDTGKRPASVIAYRRP